MYQQPSTDPRTGHNASQTLVSGGNQRGVMPFAPIGPMQQARYSQISTISQPTSTATTPAQSSYYTQPSPPTLPSQPPQQQQTLPTSVAPPPPPPRSDTLLPIEQMLQQVSSQPQDTSPTQMQPQEQAMYYENAIVPPPVVTEMATGCFVASCSISFGFTFVPKKLMTQPPQYAISGPGQQPRHASHDSMVCTLSETTIGKLTNPPFLPTNVAGERVIVPLRITVESTENSSPWPLLAFADWCPVTTPSYNAHGNCSLTRIPPAPTTVMNKCVYDVAATPDTKYLAEAMQSRGFLPIIGFSNVADLLKQQVNVPEHGLFPAVSEHGENVHILCNSALGIYLQEYQRTLSSRPDQTAFNTVHTPGMPDSIVMDRHAFNGVIATVERYLAMFSSQSINLTRHPTCIIDFDFANPNNSDNPGADQTVLQAFGQFTEFYGKEGSSFLLNTPYSVAITLNVEYMLPCHPRSEPDL